MAHRRILLLSNSPRIHRYFRRLSLEIGEPELTVRRIGVRGPGPALPGETIDAIIGYGMRRKMARPHHGPIRLAAFRALYSWAAQRHFAHALREIERAQADAVGVWGGHAVDARAGREAAAHLGIPCFQFENGFLPDTTQLDLSGVNAESSLPRDPSFYRSLGSDVNARPSRGLVVRSRQGHRRPAEPIALPSRYLFVPFQVHLDSQVLLHSPWIRGMRELFGTLVGALYLAEVDPVALVFKEHPNCPAKYPDLYRRAEALQDVHFANGNSTEELIRRSMGVVTLNSSVGCDALRFGRPVLTLGNAVYSIPGVASTTHSIDGVVRFFRAVAADSLPAASLREPFLRYLSGEFLIPDRHQDPGPAHFEAVQARLRSAWKAPSREGSSRRTEALPDGGALTTGAGR